MERMELETINLTLGPPIIIFRNRHRCHWARPDGPLPAPYSHTIDLLTNYRTICVYNYARSVTHTAAGARRLHAAAAVVPDAAGRVPLSAALRPNLAVQPRVSPHARRELGAQVDQVRPVSRQSASETSRVRVSSTTITAARPIRGYDLWALASFALPLILPMGSSLDQRRSKPGRHKNAGLYQVRSRHERAVVGNPIGPDMNYRLVHVGFMSPWRWIKRALTM